jgi:hypothetical protein
MNVIGITQANQLYDGRHDGRHSAANRIQLSCVVSEKIKFIGVHLLFSRTVHR